MPILPILQYPDPRLRTIAKEITTVDEAFKKKVDDMVETMYQHKGVGLAGTQVNFHWRIFVMDISESRDQAICAINPEIIAKEGKVVDPEGCLSVNGGGFDKVTRAEKVHLRALDLSLQPFEIEAEGLMAVCIQHEIDHLNGKLFLDHLSRLKQARIKTKMEKFKRHE